MLTSNIVRPSPSLNDITDTRQRSYHFWKLPPSKVASGSVPGELNRPPILTKRGRKLPAKNYTYSLS